MNNSHQNICDATVNNDSFFDRLKTIMTEHRINYPKILARTENCDLLKFINGWSDKLGGNRLATKIFWVLNDIHDFPICKTCGKPLIKDTDINFKTKKYHEYCSIWCGTHGVERNEKRKRTNIERYGGTAPAMNEDVKQKIKDTNLKRYGVGCVFETETFKEEMKKRYLEEYGVEYNMQLESVKQKVRETCLERYGTVNGGCSKDALEKIKNTNMERYGVPSSFCRTEVKDKIKETMIRKYGAKSFLASDQYVRDRTIQIRKSYREILLTNQYDTPMFSEEEYIKFRSIDRLSKLRFKCKTCGRVFTAVHVNGQHRSCPVCHPRSNGFEEHKIFEFLSSIYSGKIVHGIGGQRIIPPFELDFYLPNKHLAIEFDGLFWHSEENGKGANYHLHKTELCKDRGIQLIHIFEDEWLDKMDIVKGRLKNMLGLYSKTVYARLCTTKMISHDDAHRFVNENHIQGTCQSNIDIGLFYGGDLVSVMTFGKARFNKNYEWELLRFCSKLGYHVIGGAGKMLKYFERTYTPKSVISYADRRWSVGKLYGALGFELIGMSRPAYFYINHHKRFSRFGFQKHKLRNKLKVYDENLTEVENMRANGYYRIWDCGNLVFVKNYN